MSERYRITIEGELSDERLREVLSGLAMVWAVDTWPPLTLGGTGTATLLDGTTIEIERTNAPKART